MVRTPGDDPAEPATEAGQEAPAGGPGRRRRRLVAVLVGTLALAALGFVLVAALLTSTTTDALDPDSAGPTGSRALARVLADHGVSVDIARGVDALADAGALEGLALQEDLEKALGVQARLGPGEGARHLRQHFRLAPRDEVEDHRVPDQDVHDLHAASRPRTGGYPTSRRRVEDRMFSASRYFATALGHS